MRRAGGDRMRCAAPGGTLIEQHRAVSRGIEGRPLVRCAPCAGTTVEVHDRRAVRPTELLVVQDVPVADIERSDIERLNCWRGHAPSLAEGAL